MKLLLYLLLAGCAFSVAAPNAPQPVAFRVGSVRFDRPESWRWVPPTGELRAAQLEKKSGRDLVLRMTFSRFPGASATAVQANLDRWVAQFSSVSTPAEVRSISPSPCPLTTVKIKGTLKGGTPGGPAQETKDTTLLGAILSADGELVVVKLTGPTALLVPEEKTFLSLVTAAAQREP